MKSFKTYQADRVLGCDPNPDPPPPVAGGMLPPSRASPSG